MGLSSLLNTARDALNAQAYGVSVTSQNITNVNTPGYVKRTALLETRVLGREDYGTVAIAGLQRNTDQFIEGRYYSALGQTGAAKARQNQLTLVEASFNDISGSGLSSALGSVNDAFQKLAADPSDSVARDTVLSNLSNFASRVNTVGNDIASQKSDMLNQMQNVVRDLNRQAGEIANLNREIVHAQAQGLDSADLRDKRDQVLLQMAPNVDLHVVEGEDGAIFVQAAGATLVEGTEARKLTIGIASGGNVKLLAGRIGSSAPSDVTKSLSGGKLAGLKEARDVDLKETAAKFDQYVYDVATALNTQHEAGYGLDGATGRKLFDLNLPGAPPAGAARALTLSTDVAGQHSRLAASDSAATVPGGGVNATKLSKLFDLAVVSGGTRTISEGYSDLVGGVGLKSATAKRETTLRSTLEGQASDMKESMSGVSLDEEMIALTKYQQGYQAAAKVFKVIDDLMQELMGILR